MARRTPPGGSTTASAQPTLPTRDPAVDPLAYALSILAGDGQTGLCGHRARGPLVVRVDDAAGNPVPLVGVDFQEITDTGLGFEESAQVAAWTNARGEAGIRVVLGQRPGAARVRASIRGVPGTFVDFHLQGEGPTLTRSWGPSSVHRGEETDVLWQVSVGGQPLGTVTDDLQERPLELIFETANTDLPARFVRSRTWPGSVRLLHSPQADPAAVTLTVRTGAQSVSDTLAYAPLLPGDEANRVIGVGRGGFLSEKVGLSLVPAGGTALRAVPEIECPGALSVRVRDEAGNVYPNQAGGRGPNAPHYQIRWTVIGGTLRHAQGGPVQTAVLEPDEQVWITPGGWGGVVVEARTEGDIPDPQGGTYTIPAVPPGRTHPGSPARTHVQDRLRARLSCHFHIEPQRPALERLRGARWEPLLDPPRVGDVLRVAVPILGARPGRKRPRVVLRSLRWDGVSSLDGYARRKDAPSERTLPLLAVQSAGGRWLKLVSSPLALRSGPQSPLDVGRGLRQLVERRGRLQLFAADSRGQAQILAQDLRVARRGSDPRRVAVAGRFPLPANPHGLTPRVGLRGALRLPAGELALDEVDLVRSAHGVQVGVRRAYRSQLVREGALGPGWGLELESFVEELAGGLIRLVNGDGREQVFLPGGDPQPGVFVQMTHYVDTHAHTGLHVQLVPRTGGERSYVWDGALEQDTNRHGQVVSYAPDGAGRVAQVSAGGTVLLDLSYADYDPARPGREGRLLAVVDDLGRRVDYEYEARGVWRTLQAPPRAWEARTPDRLESLAAVELPDPQHAKRARPRLSFFHDAEGRLERLELPSGAERFSVVYDADGRVEAEDAGGRTTTLRVIDRRGDAEVVEVESPRQLVTRFELGASPFADAGTPRRIASDGSGLPQEPSAYITELEYNAAGQCVEVRAPNKIVTQFFHDGSAGDPRRRGNLLFAARGVFSQGAGALVGPEVFACEDYDDFGHPRRIIPPEGFAGGQPAGRALEFETDPANGDLLTSTRPRAAHALVGRNDDDQPTIGELQDAVVERWEYDPWGQVTRHVDPNGFAVVLEYDGDGRLEAVVRDADDQDTRRGDVSDATPLEQRWIVETDDLGRTRAVTDPAGVTTRLDQDLLGLVWSVERSVGQETYSQRMEWDADGNLSEVYPPSPAAAAASTGDPIWRVVDRDPLGPPREVQLRVDGEDVPVVYSHDEAGRVASHSAQGVVTETVRDGLGLPAQLLRNGEVLQTIVRDPAGRPVQVEDPVEGITDCLWDERDRLRAVIHPSGDVTRLRYAADGSWSEIERYDGRGGRNPNRVPDAPGLILMAKSRSEFDALGRTVRQHRYRFRAGQPGGTFADFGDTDGLPATITPLADGPLAPGDGAVTEEFRYDRLGRMAFHIDDQRGGSILLRDPLGRPAMRSGMVESPSSGEWEPSGVLRDWVWRDDGRLESQTHALLGLHSPISDLRHPDLAVKVGFTWDELGRAATKTVGEGDLAHTWTWEYDDAQRQVSLRDPRGFRSRRRYSPEGQLVEHVAAGNSSDYVRTSWDYVQGRLESVVHDGEAMLTLGYLPQRGLPESLTYADGSSESFVWDAQGRLVEWVARDGAKLALRYASGRLSEVELLEMGNRLGLPKLAITCTHDALGRLVQAQDHYDDTSVEREYDSIGQLLKDVQGLGTRPAITVDASVAGLESRLVYPGGGFGGGLRYQREALGRLKGVFDGAGEQLGFGDYVGPIRTGVFRRIRDDKTLLFTQLDGLARSAQRTVYRLDLDVDPGPPVDIYRPVDLASRYETPTLRSGHDWTFRHDRVETECRLNHDGRGRLISFDQGVYGNGYAERLTQGFRYDARSNLTWREHLHRDELSNTDLWDLKGKWAADAADRYTQADPHWTMEYSSWGRLSLLDDWIYTYDHLGRLARVWSSGRQTPVREYLRDPLGRVVLERGDGGERRLVWWKDHVIEERDADDALVLSIQYGPGVDHPEWVEMGGRRYEVVQDPGGHVVALLDIHGAPEELVSYDAWGVPTFRDPAGEAKPRGMLARPFGFGGRRFDPEVELYQHRHRFYVPGIGRFLEPDPIGFAGGSNLYEFAASKPWNLRDPQGLEPGEIIDRIGRSAFVFVGGVVGLGEALVGVVVEGANLISDLFCKLTIGISEAIHGWSDWHDHVPMRSGLMQSLDSHGLGGTLAAMPGAMWDKWSAAWESAQASWNAGTPAGAFDAGRTMGRDVIFDAVGFAAGAYQAFQGLRATMLAAVDAQYASQLLAALRVNLRFFWRDLRVSSFRWHPLDRLRWAERLGHLRARLHSGGREPYFDAPDFGPRSGQPTYPLGVHRPRTPDLPETISRDVLMAERPVPGSTGVRITDGADLTDLDLWELSYHNNIEYSLTVKDGDFVLRSGGTRDVDVSVGASVQSTVHTHLEGFVKEAFKSSLDDRIALQHHWDKLIEAGRSARFQPPPVAKIIWGPLPEHITYYTPLGDLPMPPPPGF